MNQEISLSTWLIDNNRLDIGERIGGRRHPLYKAILKTQDKERVSISDEIVAIRSFENESSSSDGRKQINRCIDTFLSINRTRHPGIEFFYGYCLTPNFYLATQFYPKGSYQRVLNEGHLAEWTNTQKAIFIFGLANTMMHLHNNGVIHRNLKPTHILFNDKMEPIICNFYSSKFIVSSSSSSVSLSISTFDDYYSAPELTDNSKSFTPAVDVFSFGMILYTLTVEHLPTISGMKNMLFPVAIAQGRRPELLDEPDFAELNNLITSCWDNDPSNRPTFSKITSDLFKHCPLPEVDIGEYNDYKEKMMSKTFLREDDYPLFKIPPEERIRNFNNVKAAAEEGDAKQWVRLGRFYEHGDGVSVDHNAAAECYHRASELGNPFGHFNYGCILIGEGKLRDGFKLIKQASASDIPIAQLELARLYETGKGTKNNVIKLNKAKVLYKHLIKHHISSVQNSAISFLGQILYNEGKVDEAITLLQLAERHGMYSVGPLIAKILIQQGDIHSGINYIKRASDNCVPEALYDLGFIYEKGTFNGINTQTIYPLDVFQALKYYFKAIEQGHTRAKTRCGFIFSHATIPGLNNPEIAAKFYEEAADEGDSMAQHNFARMLETGNGIEKNIPAAISYYNEAIKKGVKKSMEYLAAIYEKGAPGIPPNPTKVQELKIMMGIKA